MKKIAVCLSGCGYLDGAEITEAVSTLLAIDQAGAEAICCAPELELVAVDHLTGEPAGEKRDVLKESGRIARGRIQDVALIEADQIDALIFPGGYGAAKNLCTYAQDGPNCNVAPSVELLVGDMLEAGKPIGVICIAPVMMAVVAAGRGLKPRLTIGNDPATAADIEKLGGEHVECAPGECVVDEKLKIVSTPAYMYEKGPAPVYEGIRKLVEAVLKLTS